MKILSIFGGPRKQGNTASMLNWVEEELRTGGAQVERIDMQQVKLAGCMGCYKCQANRDEPACIQRDDGNELFARLIAADALLFAAPLYCWSFPAQIKALFDRSFCLVSGYGTDDYRSLVQDKPASLLATCGGPIEGNADLLQETFRRISSWSRTRLVDGVIVPSCTTPDALTSEARQEARALGQRLTAAVRC